MSRLSRLVCRLLPRGFAAETRGAVSVETLIIVPMLAWALVAMVVFFDGFRTRNQTQVAAQVVADLLSREANMFTTAYLEGMNDVFDFIADARVPTRLRISSVMWSSAERRNVLQWSYGTRGLAPLPPETFADLAAGEYQRLVARFNATGGTGFAAAANQAPAPWLAERIPPVLPGEALIVVESFAIWSPFANVGVGQIRFAPVVVTRPRFSPFILLEGAIPVFPEDDYEVAFAGYFPNPPEQLPAPVPAPPPPPPQNVVADQNFDAGTASGWSSQTITTTSQPGIGSYLGPFGGSTWDAPVTRTIDLGAPNRASARIVFDLLIIDSWDGYDPNWASVEGDVFQILVGGVPISSDAFANWTGGWLDNDRTATVNHEGSVYTVNMTRTFGPAYFTGGCCTEWQRDQIWRVTVDIQAPPQTFTLGFRARLNQGTSDESFGIDNFRVTWENGTRTPAPFVANPAALTGTDPHTRFRTYAGCPQAAIATNWLTIRNTQLGSRIQFQRRAGGTTNLSTCGISGAARFISAQPTFILNYTNNGNGQNGQRLRLRTEDNNSGRTCDATMLVRDPNGQFWFNDDLQGFGWNAGLNMGHAQSGVYTIWLGSYNSGTCLTNMVIERY
jgi:hypothetical protein